MAQFRFKVYRISRRPVITLPREWVRWQAEEHDNQIFKFVRIVDTADGLQVFPEYEAVDGDYGNENSPINRISRVYITGKSIAVPLPIKWVYEKQQEGGARRQLRRVLITDRPKSILVEPLFVTDFEYKMDFDGKKEEIEEPSAETEKPQGFEAFREDVRQEHERRATKGTDKT